MYPQELAPYSITSSVAGSRIECAHLELRGGAKLFRSSLWNTCKSQALLISSEGHFQSIRPQTLTEVGHPKGWISLKQSVYNASGLLFAPGQPIASCRNS
jgi:hypothetical protein